LVTTTYRDYDLDEISKLVGVTFSFLLTSVFEEIFATSFGVSIWGF